ncbi:MAG TPA: hypothetical protein VFG70_02945 [Gaiellaceae bacterium]|nr:hypothetical protein [Gaiellaceae bacterium]
MTSAAPCSCRIRSTSGTNQLAWRKLEAVTAGRQRHERVGEPVVVALEVLRELPQDRAELAGVLQRLERLEQALDVAGDQPEALDVREVPARLHREEKAVWGLRRPAGNRLPRRQAVEGRVHLDRVEHLRVALEPSVRREAAWIEHPAPVVVVPARAADADVHAQPI